MSGRFATANLTGEEYHGARLRKWESSQLGSVRKSIEVAKASNEERAHQIYSQLLTTCLVRRESPAVARLLRPGGPGLVKVLKLDPDEVREAVLQCAGLSGIASETTNE